jgi:tetratricopeptide (TPR) repeat protein
MRMTRARFAALKLLMIGLIAADLFLLWAWGGRPARADADWLGLIHAAGDPPFSRLAAWAAGMNGPRTPSGIFVLFETSELVFVAVLLVVLVPLTLILLAPWATDAPPRWRRFSSPANFLRIRMRTALAMLAICGLYLGWETHEWRTWRLRAGYRHHAAQIAMAVASNLSTLRSMRAEPSQRDGYEQTSIASRRALNRSKAAAASGVAFKVLKTQEVDVLLAQLVAYTEQKHKYERAVADAPRSLAPDRPVPRKAMEAAEWLHLNDVRRALAAYDELARLYPDLVEAFSRSAWLRATCPDPQFRDGKLAVASATRACELTNWKGPDELEVLAAAYAEAGDFAAAVKWQREAISVATKWASPENLQERLDLYLSGKPYRQK